MVLRFLVSPPRHVSWRFEAIPAVDSHSLLNHGSPHGAHTVDYFSSLLVELTSLPSHCEASIPERRAISNTSWGPSSVTGGVTPFPPREVKRSSMCVTRELASIIPSDF